MGKCITSIVIFKKKSTIFSNLEEIISYWFTRVDRPLFFIWIVKVNCYNAPKTIIYLSGNKSIYHTIWVSKNTKSTNITNHYQLKMILFVGRMFVYFVQLLEKMWYRPFFNSREYKCIIFFLYWMLNSVWAIVNIEYKKWNYKFHNPCYFTLKFSMEIGNKNGKKRERKNRISFDQGGKNEIDSWWKWWKKRPFRWLWTIEQWPEE